MRKFYIGLGIVICLFSYYQNSLLKITRLEREIYTEKKLVENLEKKLLEKKINFEKKLDLEEIENEMRSKYGMIITEKINYFSTKKSKEE